MGIVLEKTREPEYPSPPRDNERKAVGWFLGGERRGEEGRGGERRRERKGFPHCMVLPKYKRVTKVISTIFFEIYFFIC